MLVMSIANVQGEMIKGRTGNVKVSVKFFQGKNLEKNLYQNNQKVRNLASRNDVL